MEKWDVYDGTGRATGHVKTAADAWLEGEYHLSASVWIINPKRRALIQRRSMAKRIRPGHWGITGGSVLAGEESISGCLREAQEELGLRLAPDDLTLLSRAFIRDSIFDDYAAIADVELDRLVLQPGEVDAVRWATLDEVAQLVRAGVFLLDGVEYVDMVAAYMDARLR